MNDSLILTLCMQENTLLISNAIIEQLGSPSLIQIRMNEEDKSLLVNPCEYGVRGAVVVPENRKYQLEMPDRSLIRRIQRITEWPDDNPRVLCGVFIPRLNAIYCTQENSTTDTTTDDSMSSTLPAREGMEAVVPSTTDVGDHENGGSLETNDITEAPAGGEDGDLNG